MFDTTKIVFKKKKVLMIGDSLQNDILGGQNFKIDTLFILNGNHKNEFIKLKNKNIKNKIKNNWKKNQSYIYFRSTKDLNFFKYFEMPIGSSLRFFSILIGLSLFIKRSVIPSIVMFFG